MESAHNVNVMARLKMISGHLGAVIGMLDKAVKRDRYEAIVDEFMAPMRYTSVVAGPGTASA